ncbi:hypothetical protein [Burkholderia cepacia]|uniref:hypothetical protein n=1 Tax=Burkholderia cepacia TaxID=292 RepID=UPI003EE288C2
MSKPEDSNCLSSDENETEPPDFAFTPFFSREASWQMQIDRPSPGSTMPFSEAERILGIARRLLASRMKIEMPNQEVDLYLLAYDCGVAEGLCGDDSVICVGMKKGLSDALHLTCGSPSLVLVNAAKYVGRQHGMLMRDLI